MPKKQQKNSYYYYMIHFKTEEAKKGRFFRGGFPEISQAAAPSWERMTPQQRAPFEEQAKKVKIQSQKSTQQLTSQGIPVSVIQQQEREAEAAENLMKRTIDDLVNNAYLDNTITSQEFFFVDGNYFCKTTDGIYFPAEFTLIKLTLQDGILQKYHTYVNPEKLPLGMQFEAMDHANKTHRLPIPPNAKGEKKYSLILAEINRVFGNKKPYPPMFAAKEKIPIIKSFLKQFCDSIEINESVYRVYPILQLFFVLQNVCAKYSIHPDAKLLPSIHVAEARLNRHFYSGIDNIACYYHEEHDVSNYCPLSSVTKWVYTIFAHICKDLGIRVVPGVHVPIGTDASNVNEEIISKKNEVTASNDSDLAENNESDHTWNNDSSSSSSQRQYSNDDDFPSLGSRGRLKNSSIKRNNATTTRRDPSNPWNMSSSSNDRGDHNDESSAFEFLSSFNASLSSRARGRGSELLNRSANTSIRGRGGRGGRGYQLLEDIESHPFSGHYK